MNKVLKISLTIIFIISIICGIILIPPYLISQIDFIGHKDPKVVADNLKRWDDMILSAEFRNGTNHCEVNLLDSINIEINVGNSVDGVFLQEKYKLSKDTIIVIARDGFTNKFTKKYLVRDYFLIKKDKLLFKRDSNGFFDTTTSMNINFNKINQELR